MCSCNSCNEVKKLKEMLADHQKYIAYLLDKVKVFDRVIRDLSKQIR